jgi:hypothetical protein
VTWEQLGLCVSCRTEGEWNMRHLTRIKYVSFCTSQKNKENYGIEHKVPVLTEPG